MTTSETTKALQWLRDNAAADEETAGAILLMGVEVVAALDRVATKLDELTNEVAALNLDAP